MRLQRGKYRSGIARINHGGMDAIVDNPQVIVVKSGNSQYTQHTHGNIFNRKIHYIPRALA
mgnify:FL=1